ncbi:MAG: phosphate--acyl-ACP acyltransferase, partial [Candidatus Omnitrophota bacterium]|nr:phosphate--acyl-ACP acyltransferase [Candidatus Omnitrophota bacterium]
MRKIVVDAMGGDYAPEVVVNGSLAAIKEYAVEVILVGDEPKIQALLKKAKYTGNR